MSELTLILDGKPQALQRHRSLIRDGRIVCYDPSISQKAEAVKQILSQLAYKVEDKFAIRAIEYLSIDFVFCFKYPFKKNRSNAHFNSKRPDIDNLVKFYLDVMQEILFDDDKKVVDLSAKKIYSETEKIIITLKEAKRDVEC